MLSLNSANSVTKKIKIKKEDCRVGTQDLLCKRQRLYHSATEPQATEQILILNPILYLSDFSDSLNSLNSMKVLLAFRENSSVKTTNVKYKTSFSLAKTFVSEDSSTTFVPSSTDNKHKRRNLPNNQWALLSRTLL